MLQRRPVKPRLLAAVRWFGTLVLIGLALFVWMAISGCEDGCTPPPKPKSGSDPVSESSAPPRTRCACPEGAKDDVAPGDRVTRTIVGYGDGETSMVITYYPPEGVSGLTFDPPPDSGPPYEWTNVKGTDTLIQVSYNAPEIHPGEGTRVVADSVRTYTGSQVHMETLMYEVVNLPKEAARETTAGVSDVSGVWSWPRPEPAGEPGAADDLPVWNLQRFIEFQDAALTPESAQDWVDWLSSDDVFFAMRMPVQAATWPTQSVTLPFFADADHPAGLGFEVDGRAQVYTAPLDLRGDRLTFAANALPQAEGELWITLGVAPDPPPVPDDVAADEGRWAMVAELSVDLSAQPDAGEGLIQPIYYCYQGSDRPDLSRQLRSMALSLGYRPDGGGLFATSYPDWCITCMGPHHVTLIPFSGDWRLTSSNADVVEAGDVMSFEHKLQASRDAPVTVGFTISTTLDLGWTLYEGDHNGPDMERPIHDTVTVDAGSLARVWLVSDPVPEGAADGPYSVTLTAADGEGGTRWASDLFWVGEWVPPVELHNVFVPLVVREP